MLIQVNLVIEISDSDFAEPSSTNTERNLQKRSRKRRPSENAVTSPSNSKSRKEDTTKPLCCSNRKKQVFKEYLEDESLWMKDILENVDRVWEKQNCCQREVDNYVKKWDRFRAELDRFHEGTAYLIKDTVIREAYNRLEDELDLFHIGVARFIRCSKRFRREITDVLTETKNHIQGCGAAERMVTERLEDSA
jgi:hypothetical protein